MSSIGRNNGLGDTYVIRSVFRFVQMPKQGARRFAHKICICPTNTPSVKDEEMKLQFCFTVLLAATAPMLALARAGLRAMADFEGSTSTNENNIESHEDEADIMFREHLRALDVFMSMDTDAPTDPPTDAPTHPPTEPPPEPTPAPTPEPTPEPTSEPTPEPVCYTGSADYVRQACKDSGSNCCVGGFLDGFGIVEACPVWASTTATVCENSCIGAQACIGLELEKVVRPDSCTGNFACFGAQGNIGAGSCRAARACKNVQGDIGAGSCNRPEGSFLDGACDSATSVGDGIAECNQNTSCPP